MSANTISPIRTAFDAGCRRCPRLAGFLDAVRQLEPEYYCKPVPPFGDPLAPLLIVGLAPGMHGANRTGRPFTGDHAGILLYKTLHDLGLASSFRSVDAADPMTLTGVRISNAVKCLPPANKPLPVEIRQCNGFLKYELDHSPEARVVLALGAIAHQAVLQAENRPAAVHRFAHAAEHDLGGRVLIDSYHCSRYNTQTRRLTAPMFAAVMTRAAQLAFGTGEAVRG